MSKTGRVYLNQSVSFPPDMLAEAKKRARNLGLSFSTYVQKCLERDLIERKAIVFQETEESSRFAAEEGPSGRAAPRPGRPRK